MVRELRLKTSDGEELGGWFIDGRSDRPIVLLLHGNGASRSRSLPEAEFVAELGSAVMLISHRAHGDSSGEYNDIGYSARKDVLAAVDWLREHKPGRPIVVWGRSLGSAAALFAAPELRETVVGFILECPYADLRQAVRNRTEFFLPLGLEQIAYAGLLTVSPLVLPHLNDISPRQAAAQMPKSAQVLILAGEMDRRSPPSEAEEICRALPGGGQCVVIPQADHNRLIQTDRERCRQLFRQFLDRCTTGEPVPAILPSPQTEPQE